MCLRAKLQSVSFYSQKEEKCEFDDAEMFVCHYENPYTRYKTGIVNSYARKDDV